LGCADTILTYSAITDLFNTPVEPRNTPLDLSIEPSSSQSVSKALAPSWLGAALATASLVACVAILAIKAVLILRININWDEFFFLSHVHELARGELNLWLQGAYTHLFRWVPWVGGNEIDQVLIARAGMLMLLVLTAALLWKLAATWVAPQIAGIAPLCYLSMSPVAKHGASFRYDSLVVPLSLLVLLLLASSKPDRKRVVGAAFSFAVAVTISVKAVLLLPVVVALLTLTVLQVERRMSRSLFLNLALFGAASALFAGSLLALHKLSVPLPSQESAGLASATIRTTVFDVPFFPQAGSFYATRYADRLAWLLLMFGGAAALLQSRYRSALACSLALAPILFYRNSFPYYYIVMLAPACVLAAVAADTIKELLRARSYDAAAFGLPLVLALALFAQGLLHLYDLRHDDQKQQRVVIDAVHQVFPQPVAYIDHSGMMASFPKVNFFMSTLGIKHYRAQGQSFMDAALARHRPPLLLANRPVLNPAAGPFNWLLARDRELIEQFYLPYWGPIRIAGAVLNPLQETARAVALPFPGRYRLVSPHPILLNGVIQHDGDIVDVATSSVTVALAPSSGAKAPFNARLLIAAARPAPPEPIFFPSLYVGL
jgi:hypothetical protein